jgi:hypothetical protein
MPKGVIDTLTGSSAKRTARATLEAGERSAAAQERATQLQINAEREARDIQRQAALEAEKFIATGDEQARQNIINLKNQLNQIAVNAYEESGGVIDEGFAARMDDLTQSFDAATQQLGISTQEAIQAGQPFAQGGRAGVEAFGVSALDPNNPLFQRRLQQGQEALNEQLAARGLFNSGAAIEAQSDLINEMTAQEQQAQVGRQLQLAQLGQPAVGAEQNLLAQQGINLANLQRGRGDAFSALRGGVDAARLANIQQGTAGLQNAQQMTGNQLTGLFNQTASNLANLRSGAGAAQAQSLRDVGQAQASGQVNIANALGAANINANKIRQAQGDALTSGLMQIAGAAAGGYMGKKK